MNTETIISEMQKGVTFLSLLNEKKILIPKIQRDYAQGRSDKKASDVRDSFLTAIIGTLTDSQSKPLILDFVYGSSKDNTFFIPLDGQQRLTTLFLLHWYLIPAEELIQLKYCVNNTWFSRFSYETRISSKDFCNALATRSYSCFKEKITNNQSLSKFIKDQSWFMWSWRKDPTIKAILVMLDELDQRLKDVTDEYRKTLWNELKDGKIAFHILPLEQFQLTDELYVKMNARGKELSSFDILKSTLEEQMRRNNVDQDIQNTWRKNIDSHWIDLFWNKLAKPHLNDDFETIQQLKFVDNVEEGYLRFLKRMMEFHLFLNEDCLECDWDDENIKRYIPVDFDKNNVLNKLRDYAVRNDVLDLMPLFCKARFFKNDFFLFVINTFNSIIICKSNGEKQDVSDLIKDICFETTPKSLFEAYIDEKITYDVRVQFYAIIQFFKYNSSQDQNEYISDEFNSWMRIIRNLSTNSNTYFYNGYDDFQKSLLAIERWAKDVYLNKYQPSITEYIGHFDKLEGFNGDQLDEEIKKARLIKDIKWKKAIEIAEEHKYFLGQIRFLLEWSKNGETYDLDKFIAYFEKTCHVFDDNGLKKELCSDYIFRNALLKRSEYMIGGCFMKNDSKDRDWSWKRYLRNENSINIKGLLDLWDMKSGFDVFCRNYKSENSISDWRSYFITNPHLYNYLENSHISWWSRKDSEVILISKTKLSSKHRELRTHYWHLKFKGQDDKYLDSPNDSHQFSAIFYRENNREFSVKFIPKWNNCWIKGQYVVSCNFDPLTDKMVLNALNQRWEKYYDSDQYIEVESLINQLDTIEIL